MSTFLAPAAAALPAEERPVVFVGPYEHHTNELPSRAHRVPAPRPDRLDDGPTGLPADFERMRWFPLPPACVEQDATAAG
ncbi:hypothetical protein ABZ137_26700 [Streptomyces bobili]|uniref:hypothetical protein n=1 Tax=Streptomyces bobili TaxID=67280 RepID=UPI0033ADB3A1